MQIATDVLDESPPTGIASVAELFVSTYSPDFNSIRRAAVSVRVDGLVAPAGFCGAGKPECEARR